MKKSELKQLIREVIKEVESSKYNIEGEGKLKGVEYFYSAKVSGEGKNIAVEDIEIYDANDDLTHEQAVINYFEKAAIEKYKEYYPEPTKRDSDYTNRYRWS